MPKCSKDQIINPSTGRCVKKTGNIGKQILSMNANNYVDQTLKKKTSNKKTSLRKASLKNLLFVKLQLVKLLLKSSYS